MWKYDMNTRFSPYPHILRCNNSQSSTPWRCTTWWEYCHSQFHAVLYGKNVLVLTHLLYDVVRNWHFHFQFFLNPMIYWGYRILLHRYLLNCQFVSCAYCCTMRIHWKIKAPYETILLQNSEPLKRLLDNLRHFQNDFQWSRNLF